MLKTGTLYHGGIMVNYQCNASCRHCLYACSPARKPGYLNEEMAEEICRLLREGDCRSVHIGGGEPFLNFNGLLTMIRALNKSKITLEYIETNAFWAADLENGNSKKLSAKEMIKQLLAENANTLCISLDPFHAEYVPYGAALNLAKLCEKTGMRYFLWKQEFLSTLSRLDPKKNHSRKEMEKALSANYINKTAQHYGITYGGRAVNIEREYSPLYPAEKFASDTSPCRNLLSTGHFHVDKDAYFIPPGCTGILIPLSEAVYGISAGRYPAFEALYHGGISSLFKLAIQHGFSPDNAGYPSKCNLCFFIRWFLSDKGFPELDGDHYAQALHEGMLLNTN